MTATVTLDSEEYLRLVEAARTPTATVTISLDEYRQLLRQQPLLERSPADARALPASTPASIENVSATDIETFIANAIDVMQYAVANLPPETSVNWPAKQLKVAASALLRLQELPCVQQITDCVQLCRTWDEFSGEADAFDQQRRRDKRPAVPASPSDFGPRTEQARRLHTFRETGHLPPEDVSSSLAKDDALSATNDDGTAPKAR